MALDAHAHLYQSPAENDNADGLIQLKINPRGCSR
jgi:hypothetical protein